MGLAEAELSPPPRGLLAVLDVGRVVVCGLKNVFAWALKRDIHKEV